MAAPVVLVMGVSGSGKTFFMQRLAARTGWPFADADLLHPQANIDKMASGIPLTDADRWPWLQDVAAWIERRHASGEGGIVACSALKRSYRDLLRKADPALRVVYLDVDREVLAERLKHRHGHFFPSHLLDGQLLTLQVPGPDENPIVVSFGQSLEKTIDEVLAALG